MPPPEFPQLPFLTRDMLPFGNKMKLELVVRSQQTSNRTIEVRGITRESKINIKHKGVLGAFLTESITQIGDFPIMLAVAPTALSNTHGDIYVSVSIRIDGDISIPLLSGYVTRLKGLSWPNTNLAELVPDKGEIVSIQVPTPSVGTDISFTVAANQILHVLSITFKLVTDATAGDRRATFRATLQGTSLLLFIASVVQAASLTREYSFNTIGEILDTTDDIQIFSHLPFNLWLSGGDTLVTQSPNLNAGDQFSNVALNVHRYFEGG